MRAIIFDLDDTLHRERCWVLSGFWSLAAHLERRHGLERRVVFRELVTAMRAGRRNGALQWLCQQLDLPEEAIPEWVQVIRMHQPRLRLAADTVRVLSILRAGWRLAVLTNGLPGVQARKVGALGVASLVDAVVYAGHSGGGKPELRPFLETAARVGTDPSRCVFVGDDPWCDVYGARRVGMRTVRIQRADGHPVSTEHEADAVITRLSQVQDVAAKLLQGGTDHVADNLRARG